MLVKMRMENLRKVRKILTLWHFKVNINIYFNDMMQKQKKIIIIIKNALINQLVSLFESFDKLLIMYYS